MLAAYVSHRLAAAHKSGSGFSGITCAGASAVVAGAAVAGAAGAGAATDFGMLRFATLAQEVIGMNDLTNCVSMQSDV
jgi:hypothetical protein